MNVTVNPKVAERIIRSAIELVQNGGWEPAGPYSEEIRRVILGTHKTYRYILLNGLLAKATSNECNPVVLQAGSELQGAFDARSLCHGVVVPIERELLGDRLGGSNEPFLNKPARFPELATTNAVRRGNDTILLETSIDVLSNMHTSEQAIESLNDCLYWVFQRESRNVADYLSDTSQAFCQASIVEFAKELISISVEGETCAILAGVTFDILGRATGRNLLVKTHKANQAGTSSNEISDIDVYEGRGLVFTAEVKDKTFTAHDVQHAIGKAAQAGHNSLFFIKGPRGILEGETENNLSQQWIARGFNVYFIDILSYFISILAIAPEIDHRELMSWVDKHAENAKVKDETFAHIIESARKQSW